jgi:teichuronic acid exporter
MKHIFPSIKERRYETSEWHKTKILFERSIVRDLKQKITNGIIWGAIGSSCYQILGLVVFVVLSRILTPVDFGSVAIIIAVVEILCVISRLGLVEVIISGRKGNSEADCDLIFWTCLVFGIVASCSLYFSAAYIEHYFQTPHMAEVVRLVSIVPFLNSLGTVPEGLLKKSFDFKKISLRILISSSLAGILSIILATQGFGMFSLAFQRLATAVLTVLMLWLSIRWRPSFSLDLIEIRRILTKGSPVMVVSLLSVAGMKFIEILIGVFLGPAVVGYFKVAGKLIDFVVQFFVKPFVDVSLSAFSMISSDLHVLEKTYVNLIATSALVSFPALAGLGYLAPELVKIIFGEAWAQSALIVQFLCFTSAVSTIIYFFSPLALSVSKTMWLLQIKFIEFFLLVIFVGICSQVDLVATLVAIFSVSVITLLLILIKLRVGLAFKITTLLKELYPTILCSLIMLLVLFSVADILMQKLGVYLGLVIVIPIAALGYFLSFYLIFPSKVNEIKKYLIQRARV